MTSPIDIPFLPLSFPLFLPPSLPLFPPCHTSLAFSLLPSLLLNPQRVMRALDKTWHPEHFFCTLCGKHFGPEGFHEKDSKAFCRECYYEKFAPHCKRCEKAIMEGFITALNAQWHPECFSCKVGGKGKPGVLLLEHRGRSDASNTTYDVILITKLNANLLHSIKST